MDNHKVTTPTGYSSVQKGHIATVVTCMEMFERPVARPREFPEGTTLCEIDYKDLNRYRELYRQVGEEWLWFSRLIMNDHKLSEILGHEAVEVYALCCDGRDIGILELDYRNAGECELAFLA